MNTKTRYYILVLCLLATHIPQAQALQDVLVDRIVAKIGSQIILQSELELASQQYLLQGVKETPELKCRILKNLVFEKALLVESHKEKIEVEKEEVARELSRRMQYLIAHAGSEASIVQHLGKPIAEIRNELKKGVKEQLILKKMSNRVVREVTATPQEVETFLANLTDQEMPYYPTEVIVRQIIRYPQMDPQAAEKLLAKLRELKECLQNGDLFEDLALRYSQDAHSASQGGALGFRKQGELPPAYEAAALALQPGEVADPVLTQWGAHLIQLISREGNRYDSRHILLKPSPDMQDLAAAEAYLNQLRTSVLAGELTFEEAARTSSQDVATASVGGILTGEQGETKIPADSLPPDVFFAIEQLASGEISYPHVCKTPDDQEVARVLFLEEKIAPHPANLTQDYVKIKQLLISKKQMNALEAWFERVKAQVFIEVVPEYQYFELLE